MGSADRGDRAARQRDTHEFQLGRRQGASRCHDLYTIATEPPAIPTPLPYALHVCITSPTRLSHPPTSPRTRQRCSHVHHTCRHRLAVVPPSAPQQLLTPLLHALARGAAPRPEGRARAAPTVAAARAGARHCLRGDRADPARAVESVRAHTSRDTHTVHMPRAALQNAHRSQHRSPPSPSPL